MESPRTGSPRRPHGRRWALWAGLAVSGIVPLTGCQVEYAGMTLPSGKYLRDDVQYFAPGPNFPWANTQAATQRARMQAMGVAVPDAGPGAVGGAGVPNRFAIPGSAIPVQDQMARPNDQNQAGPSFEGNQGPVMAPGMNQPVPAPGGGAVPPPPGGAAPMTPTGAATGSPTP